MRQGTKVQIYAPATLTHGISQFHARTGVLSHRSNVGKRWYVHLDGDDTNTYVEFLPSEIVVLANHSLHLTASRGQAAKKAKPRRARGK